MELLQSILSGPLLQTIVTIGLPIILIPFVMRFVVSNIIVFYSRGKYMSDLVSSLKEGYSSTEDTLAIKEVVDFAKARLRRFSAFRSNFLEDGKALLTRIKNVYEKKSDREKLTFPFSVTRLSECLLLAFSDLVGEYSETLWFSLIRNTRIIWFVRFSRIRFYWDKIFSVRFFENLRSTRTLFRIFRALLIPFIGVPFLIWYLCSSVFTSVFVEGAYRFFYSLLIMKAGYYAIHVFGRNNPYIERRIGLIRRENLESAYRHVESLLDPRTWEKWSDVLPRAVDRYMELLAGFGVPIDETFVSETESIIKKIGALAKRVARSFTRAYAKKNPFNKDSKSIATELLDLVTGISSEYKPGVGNPLYYLRIKEIIAGAYFASLIAFYRIRKIPLLSGLLKKVTIELVLSVSTFFRKSAVQKSTRAAKKAYGTWQIASIGYKAYQLVRGIAGPVSLAITASSPVVLQQIQDLIKEYVFHKSGRLAILVWESDLAKNNLLTSDVMIETDTTEA